ncbi:MAG TPA: class I SAM-dependent methyltransferase [Thermodesulfovibrionia bacterium]|nr:class I SAM-dependent methyltransferase [Thermodesulfovibrionia bacterium]
MAKTEIENLSIYLYFVLKGLIKGEKEHVKTYMKAFNLRIRESIDDTIGPSNVRCNICGWKGNRFKTFVSSPPFIRHNAMCPRCLSLERHREFFEIFKETRTRCPEHIKLLDIAPNYAFSQYCKKDPSIDYLSVDLKLKLAMRHMDIQALELESKLFDMVICFHVFDYVKNDKQGLKEIHRVLKDDGLAIIQEGVDWN